MLEEGTLIRTKLATDHGEKLSASLKELRHSRRDSRLEYLRLKAIVVDKLEGKGRISGLLHSIQDSATAFATVTASNDCSLWLIEASEFRAILREAPEFSMDLLAAMAKELRSGTKSLRSMIEQIQKTDRPKDIDPNVPSLKVLCYDATTWTTDGFEPAVERFNQEHQNELYIEMKFTTERLSEQTATFAAGYDAVCLFVKYVTLPWWWCK